MYFLLGQIVVISEILFVKLFWSNKVSLLILFITSLHSRTYSYLGNKINFQEFSYYHEAWDHQWVIQFLQTSVLCMCLYAEANITDFKCSGNCFPSFTEVGIKYIFTVKAQYRLFCFKQILRTCFNLSKYTQEM